MDLEKDIYKRNFSGSIFWLFGVFFEVERGFNKNIKYFDLGNKFGWWCYL